MKSSSKIDKKNPPIIRVIFIVFALGLVTAGVLYYLDYEKRFKGEVEHQLSAIAELKVGELVQYRMERLGDGNTLYKNSAFSNLVQRFLANPNDEEAYSQLLNWLGKKQQYSQYDRIFLLDTQGIIRMSVPETASPISTIITSRVSDILESKTVTFQDFYRDENDQVIYLAVLVPILDEKNNQPLGLVVLRINPANYLYPFITRWPTPSQTAETLLIRRDGNDALFLNELRFEKGTALTLRIPLTQTNTPAVKAALGQEGIVEGLDYRGVQVVADVRAVPNSPWFMVARMDSTEVYAPLRERLWIMIIAIFVLLLGMGAGLGFTLRQQSIRYYRERFEAQREMVWLQDVIERSLNEIYVFDPQSLRFIFANSGACRNIGYSLDELSRLTPVDIKPAYTEETFRANLLPLQTGVQEQLIFETIHRRKNGSEYPVEVHLQLVKTGKKKVYLALINDITERKQAEEALQESEQKFRTLFESMTEGVAIHEMVYDEHQQPVDYRILTVNPAYSRHTGLKQDQAQGQLASSLYGTGTPPYFTEYEHTARTGKSAIFESYFAPLQKHFRISLISPRRGQFATIFEDITQRLQKEKELQEKNSELERFTYTISHDLKSPLVTIRTFLGYLEQDLARADEGRIQKDMRFMYTAAGKMSQLLDELLEMSRIGRVVNPPVSTSFHDLVQESLNMVAGRVSEQKVRINVTGTPVALVGDRPRLVEIWQNLLENALKFMGDQPSPQIEIGVKQTDAEWVFFVRDNGIGIDPRHQSRVFGLFEKLNPQSEGTGLGLALVKRIVELYNGRIWLESQGLGQGACFLFTLPEAVRLKKEKN